MVHASTELSATPDPTPLSADAPPCLRCGAGCPLAVPLAGSSPPARGVRCAACGVRAVVADGTAPRPLERCPSCGLPGVLTAGRGGAAGCSACGPAAFAAAADPELVAASLAQAVRAVAARPVEAAGVVDYLARIAREVAPHVPRAPGAPLPRLVADDRVVLLALPPAALVVSVGALHTIRDESELAFVLAHELGHLADPEAAARLARLGLVLAPRVSDPWGAAARVLLELGHGDDRELAADLAALEAAAAAGYDAGGAARWLERLDGLARDGDRRIAELALAHPAASERLRRLDPLAAGRLARHRPSRVNREPFRRAAGHAVLSRLSAAPASPSRPSQRAAPPPALHLVGLGGLAALLAALAGLVGYWVLTGAAGR